MRAFIILLFFSLLTSQAVGQDYLSTQGTTLPGTVQVSATETVTGKVSYSVSSVFVQPEGKPVVTYPAADVIGFTLEQGGGEFISVASGKKGRSSFYEVVSPKNDKLILVANVTSIDNRGKTKDEFGMKIVTRYSFYSPVEKTIAGTNLKEISAFLQTRCKGISTAITEYKDKTYHFGPMAEQDEIKRKYLRIVDDYANNRCEYIPKDY